MVAKIINIMETMYGTSLEWQTLPASQKMESSVLMGFGWPFLANVIPGAAFSMITSLVSMMLPFWLVPPTIFLLLIYSTTIVPQTVMTLDLQLLF